MGVNDMLRVPAKALTNYKLLYPVAATQQVSRRQEITFKRVSRQEGKVGERGFESTPWKGFYGQEGRGMINVNKGINNEGEALEDPTHDTMGEVQVDASEERDELNLPKISSYN
ncbi:hypothetical protein VIGAN_09142700 [Vigna angularis var. angularis]|uniref:Uncharacterized protein n=1 Tax=Vigna angularis var. angularis TaxID=157739 RepID=A0A0S3SYF2_PHAAN|nr:hypothetical protein VIGAN_09142700 [Vigna angularis var. angularis]